MPPLLLAATTPAGVLDNVYGLSISPTDGSLYATSASLISPSISHFGFDAAGNLVFDGCTGNYPGCTPISAPGVLNGANAAALSGDGAHLFVTTLDTPDISYFTIAGFV